MAIGICPKSMFKTFGFMAKLHVANLRSKTMKGFQVVGFLLTLGHICDIVFFGISIKDHYRPVHIDGFYEK
ncbi:hypothetical protein PU629_21595 [Pullulanibacillus sp. KACC 23026]|uniref:hypothetical protein n=1 Tax=Pullulanibacillus sp. KACC 23026 TaxID=3028315 RepID=UPI0023B1A348|nr:hypothetical protein [Pullulanibacillus sp. KACC 23026]WEG12640.1 hypothetical protein PU629_21595 [Pullulanibacillus sp. KACC 23026]